jgi:hypothetical protein
MMPSNPVVSGPTETPRRNLVTTIIAIGFAFGAIEHAVGFVLLVGFQIGYAGYPAWRHAGFTFIDTAIAYVAARYPDRLFIPVLAFFIEQTATNGVDAWREWRAEHGVLWVVVVEIGLVGLAAIITGRQWTGRMRAPRRSG